MSETIPQYDAGTPPRASTPPPSGHDHESHHAPGNGQSGPPLGWIRGSDGSWFDPLLDPQSMRPDPHEARRLSREHVRQMRKIEAAGVPFFLHRTGIEATVRAISFADKVMLAGLPPYLQQEWTAALNQGKGKAENKTFADYMRAAGNDERLANICCVAGFISPRLTLTEAEADHANDPDVWWVGELHLEERKRFMSLSIGGAAEEDLKRIAGFLDSRLADSDLG